MEKRCNYDLFWVPVKFEIKHVTVMSTHLV